MPKHKQRPIRKAKVAQKVADAEHEDEGAPDELTDMGWTAVPDQSHVFADHGRKKSASDRLDWATRTLAPGIDGVMESAADGGLFSLEVLDGSAVNVVRHENGALEICPREDDKDEHSGDEPAAVEAAASAAKGSKKTRKRKQSRKRQAAKAKATSASSSSSSSSSKVPEEDDESDKDLPSGTMAQARGEQESDSDDPDDEEPEVPAYMLPLTEAPGASAADRWAHNPYMMASEFPTPWSDTGIEPHPLVAAGVISLRFAGPTPVQSAVLLEAVTHHRDVVAAAETGSGKTLAFGLPMLQRVVERRERLGMQVESVKVALSDCGGSAGASRKPFPERFETLAGLVIVPTRELALQVQQHVKALARHTCVSVVAIVGGMSEAKQERLLNGHPDIVVATPGRLWDWIKRGHPHLSQLHKLQVLVLDEADRLAGHVSNEDLGGILQLCTGTPDAAEEGESAAKETTDPILLEMEQQKAAAAAAAAAAAEAEAEGEGEGGGGEGSSSSPDRPSAASGRSGKAGPRLVPLKAVWTNRQTLLFSATLGFSQGEVSVKSSTGKGGRVSVKGRSRGAEAGQRAYLRSLIKAAGGEQALSKKQLRRLQQQAKRMSGVDALLIAAGVSPKPLVLRVASAAEPSVAALLAAEAGDGIKSAKGEDGSLEWGTAGERLVEPVPSQPWMRGTAPAGGPEGGEAETMVILRGRAAVESGGVAPAQAAAGAGKTRSAAVGSSSKEAAPSAAASAAAQRLANAGASIALPRGLRLQRVLCGDKERDTRLYWVLSLVQGRAIVFVNSIAAVRSVTALLQALRIPAQPVHAKMQQRQRLKQLDRFKTQPMGVLVATDVAARGLDVQGVSAVIHYHVPRQADIFVHRSGRTARAGKAGIAITLVTPGEAEAFERILVAVRDATGCPSLPLDRRYERRLAERVTLARQIAKLDAEAAKVTGKRSWLEKIASESGLQTADADLDMGGGAASESAELAGKATGDARKLRGRLADLLSTPLLPEGVSRRYLTTFAGMPGSLSRGKVGAVPGGTSTSTALLAAEPAREEVVRSHKRPRDKQAAVEQSRQPSTGDDVEEGDEGAFLSDDEESLQWSDDDQDDQDDDQDDQDDDQEEADAAARGDGADSSRPKRTKPAPRRRPRSGGLVAVPVSAVAALARK